MRVHDGDRVNNSACAGREISPMLVTPFLPNLPKATGSYNSTYYCASIVYAMRC